MLLQYQEATTTDSFLNLSALQNWTYQTPFLPRLCSVFLMPDSKILGMKPGKTCNDKKKNLYVKVTVDQSSWKQTGKRKSWPLPKRSIL